MHVFKFLSLFFVGCFLSIKAHAAGTQNWKLGLPEAASSLAKELNSFHNLILMPLITVITVLVLALLLYTCWRFSEKRNPKASKTTHNTLLEILWTVIPIIILAALFVPSMRILYLSDATGNPDMTLKITGHQWYWSYEYPDYENLSFDAIMAEKEELPQDKQKFYKMMTDNIVALPINKKIRLLITASDVLHNWSISDFGVRTDAVPGRLNEAWVQITKPGLYFGFCSELCGERHSYMPITVQAMPQQEFDAWIKNAKKEFAYKSNPSLIAGN